MSEESENESNQFIFGTQAQAAIDEWDRLDQQKARIKLLGKKFTYFDKDKKKDMNKKIIPKSTKSRIKVTKKKVGSKRKRPSKIGSISTKMAKKYSGSIADASGQRQKLRDRVADRARSLDTRNSMSELLYTQEEWSQVLSQITRSVPKAKKLRKETAETMSQCKRSDTVSEQDEQHGSGVGDSQLWLQSATGPEIMTKEDVKMLYDYSSAEERSFLGDENKELSQSLVMTLSQIIRETGVDDRQLSVDSKRKLDTPITILDSCSDNDAPMTFNNVEDLAKEMNGDEESNPIELSSSPKLGQQDLASTTPSFMLKSINQLPDNLDKVEEISDTSSDGSNDLICLGYKAVEKKEEGLSSERDDMDTSSRSVQVPSSQKSEKEEKEEDSTNCDKVVLMTAPDILNDRISAVESEEITDSQNDLDSFHSQCVFFEKFSTKQLRSQIVEWGLKPVKSRKGMLSLLQMTCGMMDEKLLKRSLKRFKEGKDDIVHVDEESGQIGVFKQKEIVRKNLFKRIRNCLVDNKQLYNEVLVYKPLSIDGVMKYLHSKGMRDLDTGIVCDCLDELGICFTNSQSGAGKKSLNRISLTPPDHHIEEEACD
ncbi:hypothetical protein FOA43_000940 [Brettanomyces nanus]|uniref:Structure-specific endonuclease subunit SLX4 n=1 Tax=Eeniella nana TaxID=13502 RepID=A0A875RY68_EENNA|nr:uncharacterized protein FOA43_000940 [Brettanomyces nanus]QPG73628.1 hypothetical protein FOA43_000940 [Brettanomyces nanus]